MGNSSTTPYDDCDKTTTAREVSSRPARVMGPALMYLGRQVYEQFSGGASDFLSGKVAIVTGGNSGIGTLQSVFKLAVFGFNAAHQQGWRLARSLPTAAPRYDQAYAPRSALIRRGIFRSFCAPAPWRLERKPSTRKSSSLEKVPAARPQISRTRCS